ncbi:MAG: hypothetical protein HQL54_04500 [Magnetococcales bacterium]|nr:hypothetical protein [Magnetococcales bacterium]
MFTKLEAVNQMLEAIGESPVSSLDAGLVEAQKAIRVLERVTKEVLGKGWHYNTDRNITLVPDINQRIPIAEQVLLLDSTGKDKGVDVTLRFENGQRCLFNLDNRTFTFKNPVLVDIVWSRDFTELPHALQLYVAALATRKFQESEMGSVALDSFTRRQELEAWTALMESESEMVDVNILTDNPHCRFMTQRHNPLFGS